MKSVSPLQIIILGGTGDLSTRKLLPALFDLYCKDKLPKKFSIFGIARRQYSHQEYRLFVNEIIVNQEQTHHDQKKIDAFCKRLFFVSGSFEDDALFQTLKKEINFVKANRQCTNRIFYLAVPPSSYSSIFKQLHHHKLHKTAKTAWSRLLVEKPFGNNVATAQKLDKQLGNLFAEEQIFRIDHYLAKEAVQNILSFRFANTLMQRAWNKEGIESIKIVMHEKVDASNRGAFYDGIGALRDVGQNHLLQLLALLTMSEPACFDAEHIRTNRLAILKKLQPLTRHTIAEQFVRAQYAGYRDTTGVGAASDTETFFELKAELRDPNWTDVPIFLSAGKALDKALVEVTVTFKDVATGLFLTANCETTANQIRLTISPEQQMHITLNAKKPGLGYQLESRTLSFDCAGGKDEIKNSYEKVLIDCIHGDQTLFTTTEEVLAQWKYINTILKHIESVPLQTYKKGSGGPKKRLL